MNEYYIMAKTIVITGTSCSGKTTLINLLKNLGYNIVNETAREIIKEEQKKEHGSLPWNEDSFFDFQNISMKKQLKKELKIQKDSNNTYFLDRSIIDYFAYTMHKGYSVNPNLIDILQENPYSKVFFLETLERSNYRQDKERKEEYNDTLSIENFMRKLYSYLGYKFTQVSNKLTPKQRVDFILANI